MVATTPHGGAGEYQPVSSSVSSEADAEGDDTAIPPSDAITRGQSWSLYISHFLSMWNSRTYEFGAILFIQAAFPGNLLASSINGIAETVCVLLFSSALGHWVDHNPSRLHTLLLTIITNRVAVIVSSFLWFFILSSESPSYKHVLFASALVLGMVEKSSRMTNILSMERDWVPTIASSTLETPYDLTHLNTIMRRIDMLCKFLAPLAISTFISAVGSIKMAVAGVVIMSMLSCGPECWCVQRVWRQNRLLRLPKATVEVDAAGYADLDTRYRPSASSRSPFQRLRILAICLFLEIRASIRLHINSIQYYFRSAVWIPSLCVAILHGSVLTYSATFITYLLNAGFSMGTITIFKLIGSLFEISSTFIFPWAVGMCSRSRALNNPYGKEGIPKRHSSDELLSGSTKADDNEDAEEDFQHRKLESHNTDAGVVRVGLWGLCGLFLNLIPVLLALFLLHPTPPPSSPSQKTLSSSPPSPSPVTPFQPPLLPTTILITFLSLSLLGRWTYDLSATQLTQTLVPASHRSSFGGTEMAVVSCVSLGHWVAAAIWHQQGDFRWLAVGSFVAVGVGTGAYAWWVRGWEGEREEGRRGERGWGREG